MWRQKLALAAALLFMAIAIGVDAQPKPTFKPKNVVLFLNDQQSNLDWFPKDFTAKNLKLAHALQSKGMKFKNAYTAATMCSSARASLVTGLYNAQHRVTLTLTSPNVQSPYEPQLSDLLPTFGHMLGENGYDVVYFGKNHLSKGYFNQTSGQYVHDDLARYGFNDWNGEPPLGTRGIGGFGGQPTLSKLDVYAAGNATAWLKERMANITKARRLNKPYRPFMLIVSIWNPHDMPIAYPGVMANVTNASQWNMSNFMVQQPNVPRSSWSPKWWAGGYTWDYFKPTNPPVSIPPTATENLPGINFTTGRIAYTANATIKPSAEIYFRLLANIGLGPCQTTECMQNYTNLYAQGVVLGDKAQYPVYQLLASDGLLLNETIIIKAADHGEMMMAHGAQRQKPFVSYREALGVSLVWSNPVLFPKPVESDALVSHVDFVPTLLDILNIKKYKGMEKYKLQGKSYLPVLLKQKKDVQDYILFEYNDDWATSNMGMPPAVNQLFNLTNFPITNVTYGIVPGPMNIMAMYTKEMMVAINYSPSSSLDQEAPEETTCYDLTPTGGDYNFKYNTPTQRINLSPWANDIRKSIGVRKAGTSQQQAKCAGLLKKLRELSKPAFKPLPRLPFQEPQMVSMRLFKDPALCKNLCLEALWWSNTGQDYSIVATVAGQGGVPFEQQLPVLLMTQGDTNGQPNRLVQFAGSVPGCNGPVYVIAPVSSNTKLDSLRIRTAWTQEQSLATTYISPRLVAVPTTTNPQQQCYTNCPWNPATQGPSGQYLSPYAIRAAMPLIDGFH